MDNKQLYDAISGIDDEFTDRVSSALKNNENKCKKAGIKPVALVALAVTALVISVASIVLLISRSDQKNGIEAILQNSEQKRLLGNTNRVEIRYEGAKRTDEGSVKPMEETTGVYVEFIYPSQVSNGGAFEFMLSIGRDENYEDSIESPEGGVISTRSPKVKQILEYIYGEDEFISYNHYVSLIVTSDHLNNGSINSNLGDYSKYAKTCRNGNFIFEGSKGMLVEELPAKNAREQFLYKFGPDFTLDGPLPYNRVISAEAVILSNRVSGRISAAVHFTKGEGDLMESSGIWLGHSIYYYCAGDVIGFGETLEEAQANASSIDVSNIIYVFDGYAYFSSEADRLRAIEEEYKNRGLEILY